MKNNQTKNINHKNLSLFFSGMYLLYILLIATFLLLFTACSSSPKEEQDTQQEHGYFFDSNFSENGNGTKQSPYNSLKEINNISLQEGENIYLKNNSVFTESLFLNNLSGTENTPIQITNYGEGKLPIIDGNNCVGSGVVYIKNCNYLTVKNLEIQDSATEEGDRRGVLVEAEGGEVASENNQIVVYTGVTLENLYIHDIRGIIDGENNGMSTASKMTGGVQLWAKDAYATYYDFTMNNCKIENVDNVGFSSSRRKGESDPYSETFKDYAFKNIKIINNEIFNIGKNAIFLRNAQDSLIENNVVHDTATRCYSGNQIVTRSVNNILIQYNEGYNNMARENPSGTKIMDGSMLDADLLSRNTIWQYNYSHDNSFGLFLNCTGKSSSDTKAKDRAVVRFNLSVNDYGRKGIIYINYYAANIEVYNNTIITSAKEDVVIFQSNENRTFHFYNNLIYNYSPSASFSIANTTKKVITNNLVYNHSSANISSFSSFKQLNEDGNYEDPEILGNIGETLEDRIGLSARDVCKLTNTSPAYDMAIDISDVDKDMFGKNYRNVVGCSFN